MQESWKEQGSRGYCDEVNHVWCGRRKPEPPLSSITMTMWFGPGCGGMNKQRGGHNEVRWPAQRSQASPLTGVRGLTLPLCACSSSADFVCPSPLSVRSCRCGRALGALGHHRAACAATGGHGVRGVVGPGSPQTSVCATWIWHSTTTCMADGWKRWRTGCPLRRIPVSH